MIFIHTKTLHPDINFILGHILTDASPPGCDSTSSLCIYFRRLSSAGRPAVDSIDLFGGINLSMYTIIPIQSDIPPSFCHFDTH